MVDIWSIFCKSCLHKFLPAHTCNCVYLYEFIITYSIFKNSCFSLMDIILSYIRSIILYREGGFMNLSLEFPVEPQILTGTCVAWILNLQLLHVCKYHCITDFWYMGLVPDQHVYCACRLGNVRSYADFLHFFLYLSVSYFHLLTGSCKIIFLPLYTPLPLRALFH